MVGNPDEVQESQDAGEAQAPSAEEIDIELGTAADAEAPVAVDVLAGGIGAPRIKPKGLFCKGAWLWAVIGGVVMGCWLAMSVRLESSAFNPKKVAEHSRTASFGEFIRGVEQSLSEAYGPNLSPTRVEGVPDRVPVEIIYREDFLSRVCGMPVLGGMFLGFALYHWWRGRGAIRRRGRHAMLWVFLIGGVCAAIGGTIGASVPLPEPYASYAGMADGRVPFTVQIALAAAVVGAGIAGIFASAPRRAILKSLFVPTGLGLVLTAVVYTFVPLNAHPLWQGALVYELISGRVGAAVAAPFLVGLIVALVRLLRRRRESQALSSTGPA